MNSSAFIFLLLVVCASGFPQSENKETVISGERDPKGIFDGLAGTTTAAPSLPGGLSGLPSLGQSAEGAQPLLIIGGFQAVVTKFDPSLVQGLPGLAGAAPVG